MAPCDIPRINGGHFTPNDIAVIQYVDGLYKCRMIISIHTCLRSSQTAKKFRTSVLAVFQQILHRIADGLIRDTLSAVDRRPSSVRIPQWA